MSVCLLVWSLIRLLEMLDLTALHSNADQEAELGVSGCNTKQHTSDSTGVNVVSGSV